MDGMHDVAEYAARHGVTIDFEHPKIVQALVKMAAVKAQRARTNPVDFFEYAMVTELTRKPIRLGAHQKVGIDFILSHDRSINMWPVNHSKSWSTVGLTLLLLGQDPTTRGAVVAESEDQAAKILDKVKAEIEVNEKLRSVFPELHRSTRPADPWTSTAITVERMRGIRDPSLIAVGMDSKRINGARLNWVVGDDLLSMYNTRTKEQRNQTYDFLAKTLLPRLDRTNARVALTNTPWHRDDVLHRLRSDRVKWPSIRMDITGDIEVWNTEWDHPLLRPKTSSPTDFLCRLTTHDPDPNNQVVLWPELYDNAFVESLRDNYLPQVFAQLFRCMVADDESSLCKSEWIEQCKLAAREAGVHGFVSSYAGPNPVIIGVDLAVKTEDKNDDTAFFVAEIRPDGRKRILEIDYEKLNGPDIIRRMADKHARYGGKSGNPPKFIVEDNAAQAFILQFAEELAPDLLVEPHTTTGRNKYDINYGVTSVFVRMMQGMWLVPNDVFGRVDARVQRWLDACTYFTPSKHPDDTLMASWFVEHHSRDLMALGDAASDMDDVDLGMVIGAR